MKRLFLCIVLLGTMLQLPHADDLFDCIYGDFFQPFDGSLTNLLTDGYLRGRSAWIPDDILYEQISVFDMNLYGDSHTLEEHAMRYFGTIFGNTNESIIEIFGQQFPMGFWDHNPSRPRASYFGGVGFWRFEYAGRIFFCIITEDLTSNYISYMLLFDVTDRDNVRFHIYDTYQRGYTLRLFYRGDSLFIPVSNIMDYYGNFHARFLSLDTFEYLTHENGDYVEFVFGWNRHGQYQGGMYYFVSSNFPTNCQLPTETAWYADALSAYANEVSADADEAESAIDNESLRAAPWSLFLLLVPLSAVVIFIVIKMRRQ